MEKGADLKQEKQLSICIAIYNIREEFLRACIESVCADSSEEVEILLGDDASRPPIADICRGYAKRDARIRYIRRTQNGGVSAMRNQMIAAAKGRFITFIDGDDAVPKGYASCLCRALSGDTKDLDILMFQWRRFETDIPKISADHAAAWTIAPEAAAWFSRVCLTGEPPNLQQWNMKDSTPSSVCIKAYRRDFLNENRLLFEERLKKSQDVVFNTRAYHVCKNLGYLPKPLYFYRKNADSVTNRYSADMDGIIRDCLRCDQNNQRSLFDGDGAVMTAWRKYKLIHYMLTMFALNIFHKKNPKRRTERRRYFLSWIHTEPFSSFLRDFDLKSYEWRERRLIVALAKQEAFLRLDLLYRHPFLLRLYGKTGCLADRIKNKTTGMK